MSAALAAPPLLSASKAEIVYPEDDGNPTSDHTLQFRLIVTIKEGIEVLFANANEVLVAGDLLWYPVEGEVKTRVAPDVMIVFGRGKEERGSYQQWRESEIAPQVVFEILSPGNRFGEMSDKYRFYSRHGVEEYYLYNPFTYEFRGWVRPHPDSPFLEPIDFAGSFVSPRLGIRFLAGDVESEQELQIFAPNGERFLTFVELNQARRDAEQRATTKAERAERLAAQLRALGIEPQI